VDNQSESMGIAVQDRPSKPGEPPPFRQAEPAEPQSGSHTRMGLLIAVFLLLAVAGAVAYSRWRIQMAWPAGLIQVNGRMEGDQVTISSKLAGRIEHLFAREGDTVANGQVLVQLDTSQTRDQLAQAQANLQMAIAQAQGADTNVSLTAATTNAQLVQTQGVVSQAESGISGAKADLERAEATVVYAIAMVHSAEANVSTAQAALEAALSGKPKAEAGLASAQAQVVTAQANVRAAQATTLAAQATYDRAAHDASRMSQLFRDNAISAQAMDQATLAAKAAKAQVESARQQAEAAEAVVTARQSDVESQRQQVEAAEAAIAQAKAQKMAAQQQVAAANADKQQMAAQVRAAQEAIHAAQAKREQALGDLAKARTAPQQVDISRTGHSQAKAHIQQARAAVQELESVLKDFSLVSPISGTVTTRMRDGGEVVSPGTPVLDLVDLDRLYLKAYVPENQIGKLRLGLPARIYVDAFPNTPFDATVGYIASTAEFTPKEVQSPDERVKQVYAIKLYLKANPEHRLPPGMVADAVIQWKEGEKWQKPRW